MAGLPVLDIPLNNSGAATAAAAPNARAAVAHARTCAGPQYNTQTNGPWQRHTNDTGVLRDTNGRPIRANGLLQGINWDKPAPNQRGTAWSTRPPNYRIPTDPALQPTPPLNHLSPQADVNLFLRRLGAKRIVADIHGGVEADAQLIAAGLRPRVHPFQVSSKDNASRRATFHHHSHHGGPLN